MYKLCLSLIVAVAVPSIATAGGGGSKSNGKVEFCNVTDQQPFDRDAYVYLNPSEALLAQFRNNDFSNFFPGGRLIPAGRDATYTNLRSGSYPWVVLLAPAGDIPDVNTDWFGQADVKVEGGKTVKILLIDPDQPQPN